MVNKNFNFDEYFTKAAKKNSDKKAINYYD